MCDQQRLRPASAYAQSDQSLCWPLEFSMRVERLTDQHLEFQSLTGGTQACLSLFMSKYHIVGNHTSRLILCPFYIACAFSISSKCLAHFLLNISHTCLPQWDDTQSRGFRHPASRSQWEVKGHMYRIFDPEPQVQFWKYFTCLSSLMRWCAQWRFQQGQGLSRRPKVICTEFVSATYLLLWFQKYFEHMSTSMWWHAEQGFSHPTS